MRSVTSCKANANYLFNVLLQLSLIPFADELPNALTSFDEDEDELLLKIVGRLSG
jgi:hypothetical protein